MAGNSLSRRTRCSVVWLHRLADYAQANRERVALRCAFFALLSGSSGIQPPPGSAAETRELVLGHPPAAVGESFWYHAPVPLSWNEIRHRAIAFSKEWTGVRSERAEKQTFWNEFFKVFGIPRRAVASFEEPVKGISGRYGYIDLFWPGVALVEHKSLGKDLGKAESQAFRYIQDLAREGRTDEIPRYVIVSDFARIALHDLEPEDQRHLPRLAGSRTPHQVRVNIFERYVKSVDLLSSVMIPLTRWAKDRKRIFKNASVNECVNCGSRRGFHRSR